MTSRPSPRRRSSGSRFFLRAVTAAALVAAGAGAAASAVPTGEGGAGPLREAHAGVTIDWADGTLASSGGAAADLRMPGAELARPGAVRRAREVALTKLRAALVDLPLGGGRTLAPPAIERA